MQRLEEDFAENEDDDSESGEHDAVRQCSDEEYQKSESEDFNSVLWSRDTSEDVAQYGCERRRTSDALSSACEEYYQRIRQLYR